MFKKMNVPFKKLLMEGLIVTFDGICIHADSPFRRKRFNV